MIRLVFSFLLLGSVCFCFAETPSGVQIIGFSKDDWNPLQKELQVRVLTAKFVRGEGGIVNKTADSSITISVNDDLIEDEKIKINSPDTVAFPVNLKVGKNRISVLAAGEMGSPRDKFTGSLEEDFFVGTQTANIEVRNFENKLYDDVKLVLTYGEGLEANDFVVTKKPKHGKVVFKNLLPKYAYGLSVEGSWGRMPVSGGATLNTEFYDGDIIKVRWGTEPKIDVPSKYNNATRRR